MTNLRHNWRDGYHPFLAVPGGSSIRPWGMDVPALGPVQGGGSWAPCQTQVIEWPWAVDEAGVEYDQDNIWGVRTRCWGTDLDENPGDRDWWVAVPKVLGEEYTPRGRSHVQPMIYDHLGDDPMQGVVEFDGMVYSTRPVRWRTPTGQYPSDLMDQGYLWVPMNLNQQCINWDYYGPEFTFWDSETGVPAISVSGTNPLTGLPYSDTSTSRVTGAILMGMDHIGFRGGMLNLEYGTSSYAETFPVDFKIRVRVVIGYSDAPKSAPDQPDTITDDIEYDETDLTYDGWQYRPEWGGSGYFHVWSIDLPMSASMPTPGERKFFMVTHRTQLAAAPGTGPALQVGSMLHWSPRTDVPLWYWASQRNRAAPGGIILP